MCTYDGKLISYQDIYSHPSRVYYNKHYFVMLSLRDK